MFVFFFTSSTNKSIALCTVKTRLIGLRIKVLKILNSEKSGGSFEIQKSIKRDKEIFN